MVRDVTALLKKSELTDSQTAPYVTQLSDKGVARTPRAFLKYENDGIYRTSL
jgi:hypothetical protein